MCIGNWPSCYMHEQLKLMLMVYVDDFKLAGPEANLTAGWKKIKEAVHMGEPEAPGLFLGCEHRPFKTTLPDGTEVNGIEYDVSHYLEDTVDIFLELSKAQTGKVPVLETVPHPFLPEDHKESPSWNAYFRVSRCAMPLLRLYLSSLGEWPRTKCMPQARPRGNIGGKATIRMSDLQISEGASQAVTG